MFNLLIYDYCIRKGVKIKKKIKGLSRNNWTTTI